MIIINPIPGQEEENAEFLERQEVGIWIKKEDNVKEILKNILYDESKLNTMHENALKLSRRNSTHDICNIILN